ILNAVMARIKIMSKTMDITERRLPQDGRLLVTFEKRPIEFRVNTIPTEYGESCVMRILDRSSIMVELQKLGFDEKIGEKFRSALKKPYGIILVSGPTGSGKSTTLYSSLNYLLKESKKNPDGKTKNVSPKKILTAENPVEYNLDEIIQLNIKPDIGLTFAAAMRAFLRQDPDIIMVGEVRDRETAQIAMEAALTGHLVLSTIHTNDAPSAVSRLAEMRVPTYLISSTVEAVLAQRLVRKICPDCAKDMHRIPEKLLAEFEKHNIPREKVNLKVGEGCKECSNTGYKGRMGIYELLELDEDIRELLLEQIAASPIAKLAEKKGMRRLWEDGLIKVARGLTTYEEILRVSQ
ncbi:MAG: GspE/PulE family protein, partial [Elusimicrobiota bacterium]